MLLLSKVRVMQSVSVGCHHSGCGGFRTILFEHLLRGGSQLHLSLVWLVKALMQSNDTSLSHTGFYGTSYTWSHYSKSVTI